MEETQHRTEPSERAGVVIDLRDNGFTYSHKCVPGNTVRWYDIFSRGELGGVGDTLIWLTSDDQARGEIVDTGWENLPNPTYWADVVVSRG